MVARASRLLPMTKQQLGRQERRSKVHPSLLLRTVGVEPHYPFIVRVEISPRWTKPHADKNKLEFHDLMMPSTP